MSEYAKHYKASALFSDERVFGISNNWPVYGTPKNCYFTFDHN